MTILIKFDSVEVIRWKINHARRGVQAQQAYDDFLRGLEVAGMQVKKHGHAHTNTHMPVVRLASFSAVLGTAPPFLHGTRRCCHIPS